MNPPGKWCETRLDRRADCMYQADRQSGDVDTLWGRSVWTRRDPGTVLLALLCACDGRGKNIDIGHFFRSPNASPYLTAKKRQEVLHPITLSQRWCLASLARRSWILEQFTASSRAYDCGTFISRCSQTGKRRVSAEKSKSRSQV